jgi:hypothetical protein
MFQYPEPKLQGLGGGITKVPEGGHLRGKGGVMVHLYVESIEAIIEVSYPSSLSSLLWDYLRKRNRIADVDGFWSIQSVEKAGGKAVGKKESEGEHGWVHAFEDTEGNRGGIYTLKPNEEK